MIQVGFLLLLCIAAVTAGAPAPPAPDYQACVSTFKAAKDFNATQFASKWYEVRQILPTPGCEGSCGTVVYTCNADGTIGVDLGWVDTKGKPQNLSGKGKTSGEKPTDAQLTITFGEISTIYIIFHLVYDFLFAVYACFDNKAHVWVFARTQEIENKALALVYGAMDASGLDAKSLKPTPRTGCPATY